jgi:hypothetical protein
MGGRNVATRLMFAAAMLLMSAAATAQVLPPVRPGFTPIQPRLNPLAPSLRSPIGSQPGSVGQSLTFQWRQDLYSLNGERAATHFVVCLFNTATQTCDNTSLRFSNPATSIPRTAVTRPPFTTSPPIVVAYIYNFAMPGTVTAAQLDQSLRWSVGACANTDPLSCTFASANLVLTTKNLAATNISDGFSTSATINVVGEANNNGTTASGAFVARMELWPVIHDASTDRCMRDSDPEDPDPSNDVALTSRGELILVSDLPRLQDGSIDQSTHTIAAVISDPASVISMDRNAPSIPVAQTAAAVELSQATGGHSAWAARFSIDPGNSLAERDETDNRRGECHIIRQ